jgi:hypothetical protein
MSRENIIKRCPRGMEIQAFLFDREFTFANGSKQTWTDKAVIKWLQEQGHTVKKLRAGKKGRFIRVGVRPSFHFVKGTFKTIVTKQGLNIIVGCPRPGHESEHKIRIKKSRQTNPCAKTRTNVARTIWPEVMAVLGYPTELEYQPIGTAETVHFAFPVSGNVPSSILLTCEKGKTLFIVPNEKSKTKISEIVEVRKVKKLADAKRLFSEWSNFDWDMQFSLSIPDNLQMKSIGTATELTYGSDKWTRTDTLYVHEFSNPVAIHCDPSREFWILTGKKLRVKAEGITG